MPYSKPMEIFRTKVYARRARKLMREKELRVAEQEIVDAPDQWPVIAGTGGARKARAARGDSGKRGGVRIIYFYQTSAGAIYLFDIYAKNEQEDITDVSKQFLRAAIQTIEGE